MNLERSFPFLSQVEFVTANILHSDPQSVSVPPLPYTETGSEQKMHRGGRMTQNVWQWDTDAFYL